MRRIILIALVLVALAALWLAFSSFMAARAAQSAQTQMSSLQASLASSKNISQLVGKEVDQSVKSVASDTSQAAFWTSGPVWWAAGKIPFLGNNFRAVQATIAGADTAANSALPFVVDAAQEVGTQKLRGANGQFNLGLIASTSQPLNTAAAGMRAAVLQAQQAPASGVVDQIASHTSSVNNQLFQLQQQVAILNTSSSVLPTMLGGQGTQKYFVAFTNPNEARGVGGFLGGYGILQATNGKLTLVEAGSNSDLKAFAVPTIDLGPQYESAYGDNNRMWQNMNMSPNFPFAARQYIAGWKKKTGQTLQGAMSVDIATLGYLTDQTGPITLPNGKKLQGDEVVRYLANQIYLDFGDDHEARKQMQVKASEQLIKQVLTGRTAPLDMAPPLARAASEGRLLVYSTNAAVQQQLEQWPISGYVDTLPGPYALSAINNFSGNKIEYYLDRSLSYNQMSCSGGNAAAKITTTLVNNVPTTGKLPDYIAGRVDKDKDTASRLSTKIQQVLLLPMDSVVNSARLNELPVNYTTISDNGRPGISLTYELPAGKAMTLAVELEEPSTGGSGGSNGTRNGIGDGSPRIVVQPLVREQKTTVSWPTC